MAESALSFTINLNIPKSVIHEFFVGCAHLEASKSYRANKSSCPMARTSRCPMSKVCDGVCGDGSTEFKITLSSGEENDKSSSDCKELISNYLIKMIMKNLDGKTEKSEEVEEDLTSEIKSMLLKTVSDLMNNSDGQEEKKEEVVEKKEEVVVEKKEEKEVPVLKTFKPVYDEDTMEPNYAKNEDVKNENANQNSAKGFNFLDALGPMIQNMQTMFSGMEQSDSNNFLQQFCNMSGEDKKAGHKRKFKNRNKRRGGVKFNLNNACDENKNEEKSEDKSLEQSSESVVEQESDEPAISDANDDDIICDMCSQ